MNLTTGQQLCEKFATLIPMTVGALHRVEKNSKAQGLDVRMIFGNSDRTATILGLEEGGIDENNNASSDALHRDSKHWLELLWR